jgi:hypothetical protein
MTLDKLVRLALRSCPQAEVTQACIRAGIDAYNRVRGWPREAGDIFGPPTSLGAQLDDAFAAHWDGRDWADIDTAPIGDAYQAVDAGAVKAFAFCQSPRFVGSFLCQHALGWRYHGAMREWDPWDVRVIDPACGTGHLLIEALNILRIRCEARSPDQIRDVLSRIVGSDINPVAVALARWRVATFSAELARTANPTACIRVEEYVPTILAADALDKGGDVPRNRALPADDRARFQALAARGFHAIVANPPYIAESDPSRRTYDRRHYASAHRKYGLGVVFAERMFDLGVPGAFIAQITSNAFMKREYGKPFVQKVLPRFDVTHVINTSGAYIPGHGTPTVILFARNRPPVDDRVTCFLANRGEPSTPEDPAMGLVWTSVVRAYHHVEQLRELASADPGARVMEARFAAG